MQFPHPPNPNSYITPSIASLPGVSGTYPATLYNAASFPPRNSSGHGNPYSQAPSQADIQVPFNLRKYQGVPLSDDFEAQFMFRWCSDRHIADAARECGVADANALRVSANNDGDVTESRLDAQKWTYGLAPDSLHSARNFQEQQYRGLLTLTSLPILNWFCAAMCSQGVEKRKELYRMILTSQVAPFGIMQTQRAQVMNNNNQPNSRRNRTDVRTVKMGLGWDTFDLWGGLRTDDRLFFTVAVVNKAGLNLICPGNNPDINFSLAQAQAAFSAVARPGDSDPWIMFIPTKACMIQDSKDFDANRQLRSDLPYIINGGAKVALSGPGDLKIQNGITPIMSIEVGRVNQPPSNNLRWQAGGVLEPAPMGVMTDTGVIMRRPKFEMWVTTMPTRTFYHATADEQRALFEELGMI